MLRSAFLAALALVVVLAGLTGCATTSFDYSQISVPEEGGIRFTRITSDRDLVADLPVEATPQSLRFPSRRTFDVSPDASQAAFMSVRNDKVNVYVTSTQGSSATTQRTFQDYVFDPAFSADGERIAFADLRGGQVDVYAVSATSGSAIRQMTSSAQKSDAPMFSPDTTRMAYVESDQSASGALGTVRYFVWEMDLATNSHTQFSEGYAPTYSPDGRRLAVVRTNRDHGNSEIWLVNLDTGAESLLLSDADRAYAFPSFSPDGERLVVTGVTEPSSRVPRNLDLYLVGADGSGLTQLTFHPGHDHSALFGTSGQEIYFVSMRASTTGRQNLWRMTLR